MNNFNPGGYINQGHYKSFLPTVLNRQWQITDMELIGLLSQADRELGRLDMYSEYIPNIDLFIHMHTVKEATQSSRIEGTQTNIEEVFLDKQDVTSSKDDWQEVQNYIQAMNQAIAKLKQLPISSRLIRDTHAILLQGVRGRHKLPGEFRSSQNWIGGASISDAKFIPPHPGEIGRLMSDWETFCHDQTYFVPDLIKVALLHYQFETIHPFLDGNGRIGRLLITLYLVERGLLKRPVLYLSDFFERNRTLYYDNLGAVSNKGDLKQWLKFFLVGVLETSRASINTFDNILKLQAEVDAKLQTLGSRTANALKIVEYLYTKPIINAAKVVDVTQVTSPTAYTLLHELENLGILHEVSGAKRKRVYVFKDYLSLF
ncbi:MAG: Fic family protein [Cryomorphaceae bacterium]|nr:Fic family protein [Cryomorphaceae bacterium]